MSATLHREGVNYVIRVNLQPVIRTRDKGEAQRLIDIIGTKGWPETRCADLSVNRRTLRYVAENQKAI